MGISRYYSSTNTPPNKPYTLQNLYSPRRGELAIIPGVSELTNTIPSLTSINDIQYLEQTFGEQGFMVQYNWDTSTITAPPTSFTTSSPTGSPTGTRTVYVEYVYPGGSTKVTTITGVTYGTTAGLSQVTVTIPTSIPSNVYSINYYIRTASGAKLLWAGSVSRKNGIFPPTSDAEKDITLYLFDTTPTSVNQAIGATPPTGFTATPTTVSGGELTSGRIYFFGITPYMDCSLTSAFASVRQNRVALYSATSVPSSSSNLFSAFLPPGYNAFQVSFTGCPTSSGDSNLVALSYYQVFAGATPEDLAPIGDGKLYQATPSLLSTTTVTSTVKSLPYNTNMQINMNTYGNAGQLALGSAIAGRVYGTWTYLDVTPLFLAKDRTSSVALAKIQFPYSLTSHREMLPGGSCFLYDVTLQNTSLTSYSTQRASDLAYIWLLIKSGSRAQAYADRLYYVDGSQSPYKTNGYLISPLAADDVTRLPPITNNITLFNDRLVIGCGSSNWSYDKGLVFYSDAANPNDFGTGAGNFLNVNFGDASDLVGFGSFSKDLASAGPSAYLLVGKKNSCYIWNGGTTAADQQLIQVGKQLGWLSANSFGLTKNGPVVITNQGLFSVNGSDMNDLDPGTGIFFTDMDPDNYPFVNVVYTEDRLIVGYSTDGLKINRELWYDFRDEPDGSIVVVPTGPHVMKDYAGCVNALTYGDLKNYRVSWNATGDVDKIYRRDVPSVFTNDGDDISWIYELNETGLGSDEFLKILTRMYMRCKINKQEVVTITVPSYDSSSDGQGLDYTGTGLQTVSETLTMPYTGATEIYRLFQKVFSSRYRGAIFKPKFTGATNLDFRIISVSILSELKRRRML